MAPFLHPDHQDEEAPGSCPATELQVLNYLMHRHGGQMTYMRARLLMERQRHILLAGIANGEFAYYVGDRMITSMQRE